MKLGLKAIALVLMAQVAAPASAASLIYNFSTNEPFAGGLVSFTYETDAPPPFETFIQSSALTSFSPGLARIRFLDACFTFIPGAPSSVACDGVEAIVNTSFGSTQVFRLFQDGALVSAGTYSGLRGPASQLSVTAAAVPEPAAWALLLAGFAAIGTAVRRRRQAMSPALAG